MPQNPVSFDTAELLSMFSLLEKAAREGREAACIIPQMQAQIAHAKNSVQVAAPGVLAQIGRANGAVSIADVDHPDSPQMQMLRAQQQILDNSLQNVAGIGEAIMKKLKGAA